MSIGVTDQVSDYRGSFLHGPAKVDNWVFKKPKMLPQNSCSKTRVGHFPLKKLTSSGIPDFKTEWASTHSLSTV